jgi:hypothetical protein
VLLNTMEIGLYVIATYYLHVPTYLLTYSPCVRTRLLEAVGKCTMIDDKYVSHFDVLPSDNGARQTDSRHCAHEELQLKSPFRISITPRQSKHTMRASYRRGA